jgi:glycerol-1-phosphate dehydrogenase [NAD(P)+]
MDQKRVAAALLAATDTEHFVVAPGALERTAEVFRAAFGGATAMLVADGNTYKAAGARVDAALAAAGVPRAEAIVFPATPVLAPDYRHIVTIREKIKATGAVPVAVGAGTLNDLAKRAAAECGVRYMNVTTAASVDGFTAFGAAIVKDDFKQTLECAAPLAIVADVDVLRAAPRAMTAAGYADLMSEVTAGADWIIADALGAEAIHKTAWDIVQTDLRRWISRPAELQAGDPGAFEDLFEGLSMNGFAMQAMRSSRPASGTEHLFSHIWEMEHLEVGGVTVSHGFKVAIGTLAATALMERLLARDPAGLDADRRAAAWVTWPQREAEARARFGSTPILADVLAACRTKWAEPAALAARLGRLAREWKTMSAAVRRQLLPYAELKAMFEKAGVPTRPEQVGLTREHVRATFAAANMIRTRYTALDLAYETGWLDLCLDEIFASREYLR